MSYKLSNHGPVFDPATVRLLREIFDATWAIVEHQVDAARRDEARSQLATILLALAAEGERDPLALKDLAIGQMGWAGRIFRPVRTALHR